MAKRFTDTELYDRSWYRKLPPRLKCAWEWLNKRCCVIGTWNIDMERLSFEVGEPVTLDDLKQHFKVQIFEEDKLFIPGFVPFQYGDESGRLSPKNKFHLSVAQKLESRGFPRPEFKPLYVEETPLPTGVDTVSTGVGTPQGKGQGKGIGKGNSIQGGVGGNYTAPAHFQINPDEFVSCLEEWKKTLEHFEIKRHLGERDQLEIGRAIQEFSSEWVKLAFQGARKQVKTPRFDPKNFVSLRIYLHKDRIERLVNIGAGKEGAEGIDWGNFLGGAA